MQKKHAQLVLVFSLILLTFVTIDFFQVRDLSKPAPVQKPKTDLVEKVNEIGKVLGDVLPGSTGTYYYKFYLKDQTGTAITSQGTSDKSLIKGATVTVTNPSSFTCGDGSANYSFSEFEGLYKIICDEAATMNIRISKSGYSTKNTSVTYYQGEIPTIYLNRYVAPPPPPPPETIKDVKLPDEFTETGGSTNLGSIADPSKVDNLTLDTNSNTIKFNETVDLSQTETKDKFKELDKYVKADEKGKVSLDSTSLAVLNKKATITMKSLSFIKTPKVLVDGKEDNSVVSDISYKNGVLTFNVTHFSTFTAAPSVEITQPVDKFESKEQKIIIKGKVSDISASVSAKLNNKDLGKLAVATRSGEFSKEVTLDEGLNKIVISALGVSGAVATATVSGSLVKVANSLTAPLALLLLLLGIVGVSSSIWAVKRMKKRNQSSKQETKETSNLKPNPTV